MDMSVSVRWRRTAPFAKWLAFVGLAGASVCAYVRVCGCADTSLNCHQVGQPIRIGYAIEPPYAYLTRDGTVTGEAPEVAKRIVARLGLFNIEWHNIEFGSLINELEAGHIDVVAAGLYITPGRARRVAFSEATFQVRSGLLVASGNPKRLHAARQVAEARDVRLAVLAGSVEEALYRSLGVPDSRLVVVPDALTEQMGDGHPFAEDLSEIQAASSRAADLTRQLLAFARKQTVLPQILDLSETVGCMLKMLERLIGEDIDLAWHPGQGLWFVKIDSTQVDQILANLCVNARDAIAGVGKVTIETYNASVDEGFAQTHAGCLPGDYVVLAVTDNGCGMEKQTLEFIFEPFFTTKEIGRGTGLGLSTVYGIVKQNNGFVDVYSEPGKGSTFKIYLPRQASEAAPVAKPAVQRPAGGGQGQVILVVEDDPALLKLTKIMLEREGYVALCADKPGEAFRLAESRAAEIRLLMTDVVMPDLNGRAIQERVRKWCPAVKCLYMSGYTANAIAHHGVLDAAVHFIQKPFTRKTLAEKIQQVLADESGSA